MAEGSKRVPRLKMRIFVVHRGLCSFRRHCRYRFYGNVLMSSATSAGRIGCRHKMKTVEEGLARHMVRKTRGGPAIKIKHSGEIFLYCHTPCN